MARRSARGAAAKPRTRARTTGTSGARRVSEVDRLFERLPESYRALARALRSTIRSEAPHLTERAMWNNPFWVGKRPVLCLQCYPHHVNFGIMRGAELMTRFPRLEGTGKGMRHLRVEDITTARSEEVRAIVREAARLDSGE